MSFQTHHRGTKYHLGGGNNGNNSGNASPSSPSTLSPSANMYPHSVGGASLFSTAIINGNSNSNNLTSNNTNNGLSIGSISSTSSPLGFTSSYSADSLEEGRHEASSSSATTSTNNNRNYVYSNPHHQRNTKNQQQRRFLVNSLICLSILIVTLVLGYVFYNKLQQSKSLNGNGGKTLVDNPQRYTHDNDQALEKLRSRENKAKKLHDSYSSNYDDEDSVGAFDTKRAEKRRRPRKGSKEDNELSGEGESKTTIVHEDYTTYSSPTEKFMWRGMFAERMKSIVDCPVPFRNKQDGKLLKKVAKTVHTYLTQPIGSENYDEMIESEKISDSEKLQIDWASTFITAAPECTSKALLNKRSDGEYIVFCENTPSEPFLALTRDASGDGTGKTQSAFVNIKEKKLDSLTFEPTRKVVKLTKEQMKDTEMVVIKCSKGKEKSKASTKDVVTRVAADSDVKKVADTLYTQRVKKLEETDKELKEQSKKPKHEYHQFAANVEYEYEMMHPVNILNIILDGTSRSNFMRELPRTVNVLEDIELDQKRTMFKKPSKHRVFQFFRYNTVGHTSRENIFALENGLKITPNFLKNYFEETSGNYEKDEPERQKKLLSEIFVGAKEDDSSKLITHNLWNIAKQLGYVTMFTSSECPYIKVKDPNKKKLMDTSSHLFNTWHRADHNLLSLACEKHLFKSSPDRKCMGSKDLFEHMFEYTSDFFAKYPGSARFATIHFEESKHIRSRKLMNALDISLARFIVDITKEHPHTAIVLSSGNGISHGPFYVTDVGQKEHQLPLLTMVLPDHLQTRHKDIFTSMAGNQQQLVTPFDLYATLVHFMLFPQTELPAHYNLIHHVSTSQDEKKERDDYEALAKSIIQPMYNSPRFCKHAGVDPRWCSCTKYESLDFTLQPYTAIVSSVIKGAVTYVNKIVKAHKAVCLPIDHKSTLKANKITLQLPEETDTGRKLNSILSVIFKTLTDEVFEADYFMTAENTLDRLIDVRRVSLVENHDESVKNRETIVCDKVKGFEANPDLCICRQD